MKGYLGWRATDTSVQIATRYAVAVGCVAAGLLVAEWVHPLIDASVFLLAGVLVAAWFSGLWPALLAALLATLTFVYFFVPPIHSLKADAAHLPALAAFLLIAALFAGASAARRRAERALRQTRDELDAKVRERTVELQERADLLNLTHDTIFVRDMNDVIRYWNHGAEELYGWSSGEAIGRVSHELTQTIFPAPLEEINAELLEKGRWEGELVHARHDGSKVVVGSRWSLQRDANGRALAILETNNDITERKRAEEARRRQAELLDLTHDSIFVRDSNAVIRYWNRGAEELYGWTKNEALGRITHELLRTVFPEPFEEISAKVNDKGHWEGELVHTKRDGTQLVVASRWSLQRDDDGRPAGVLETNNDITRRKQAEDALRDSKEQWQAVFEHNPTMYFMVAPDGTVLSVNPFGAEQLGYTVRELVGQSVLKVFLPEDHDSVRKCLSECLTHVGHVMTWEIRKSRNDGTIIWVRETANAMQRTKGSPVVLIACEDISARKRAESELLESERRYRHIFHATSVSIWEEDFRRVKAAIDELKQSGVADFRAYLGAHPEFIDRAISLVGIVDVNEATLKMFGFEPQEPVSSLRKVFTPETRDVFAGELIAIAEGRPSFEGETVLQRRDGERLSVLFSVSFPPPDGSFEAVLVSIMDITYRKRAEQELEELAGRLISAQEQERSRIGRELHDHISQMLGVLTIRIDQLRADEATPEPVADALEDLRASTTEITDEIHSLSHRLHSSALDYLGLVPALQRLVKEFSARHGIAIDFAHDAVPAALPSEVALCLFRVTEESLTNIAKHSRAESARVHVKGGADGMQLTIEDAGTGFAVEGLERKAGLGFVSMRERLRAVRGRVRVDSMPSRGTRIEAWVPASSLGSSDSHAMHESGQPAGQSSRDASRA